MKISQEELVRVLQKLCEHYMQDEHKHWEEGEVYLHDHVYGAWKVVKAWLDDYFNE